MNHSLRLVLIELLASLAYARSLVDVNIAAGIAAERLGQEGASTQRES